MSDINLLLADYYAKSRALDVSRKALLAGIASERRLREVQRDDDGVAVMAVAGDCDPRVLAIQQAVAAEWGTSVEALVSKRQSREIVEPRHVAIYLCMQSGVIPTVQVVRGFGQAADSCVKYAHRAVANRVSVEPKFAMRVSALMDACMRLVSADRRVA